MEQSKKEQEGKNDKMKSRDRKCLFPTNPSKEKHQREDQINKMEKLLEEAKQNSEKLTTEFYDFSEFSNLDMQIKEARQKEFNNKLE